MGPNVHHVVHEMMLDIGLSAWELDGHASECRRVRGKSVGAARDADLWDFCGGTPKVPSWPDLLASIFHNAEGAA